MTNVDQPDEPVLHRAVRFDPAGDLDPDRTDSSWKQRDHQTREKPVNLKTGLAEWIRDNGVELSSLAPDAPLDDLEPLAGVVGEARVVALGENSHHVREFYQVRHRILRFLVERCGFTVYALEAPFTEGHVLDDWVRSGPGEVEQVASEGIAMSLGEVPELHETLAWMRSYNQARGTAAVRCVGVDLPSSIGSPLPALKQITDYIHTYDPDAISVLTRAIGLVEQFHDPFPMHALAAYPSMDESDRDALTAALSQLVARMTRLASFQQRCGRHAEHSAASHHLRGAWLLDQLHRSLLADGIEVASTFRDVYLAESVLRLLNQDPTARVVVAAHNWHIKKSPEPGEGNLDLFPAGFHLAEALGDDYRAIGLTSRNGRTGITNGEALDGSGGFLFQEAPLPPPEDTAIEAAFPDDTTATMVDLRAAPKLLADTTKYPRMRMADYFLDQPAVSAFDALVTVTETNGTKHTRD